jgi:hypothetical protein
VAPELVVLPIIERFLREYFGAAGQLIEGDWSRRGVAEVAARCLDRTSQLVVIVHAARDVLDVEILGVPRQVDRLGVIDRQAHMVGDRAGDRPGGVLGVAVGIVGGVRAAERRDVDDVRDAEAGATSVA